GRNQARSFRFESLALEPYSAMKFSKHFLFDLSFDQSDVFFMDSVTRMSASQSEFTVIGKENESLAIKVQPAHRMQQAPFLWKQFVNSRPDQFVVAGADQPRGLVQRDVDFAPAAYRLSVHCNAAVSRVDSGAQSGHRLAVDGNAARPNELFTGSSGGDAGLGEKFLQTNHETSEDRKAKSEANGTSSERAA